MKYYFQCPRCSYDEQFVGVNEQQNDLGCALFLFGGILPALLYAARNSRRVQCVACGLIFVQPPLPRSPVAKFASGLLFLLAVPVALAAIFVVSKDLADMLPPLPVISTIEDAVTMQPRVTAYLLATLFVLTTIACCLAAWVSNAKFRKKLSHEYHLKPAPAGNRLPPLHSEPSPATESPSSNSASP